MPQVPPKVPGTNREEQIAYYATFLDTLPGTYQGKYAQYQGLTWAELYKNVAQAHPKIDAKVLADKVLGLETAQKLGQDISTAALGKFLTAAEKAAAKTNFAAGVPEAGLLTGIDAIGNFFNSLGSANTWIRVAKVVAGGVLLIVGLAKMTGIDKGVVGKAVKIAPLL